jgi:hypothetical protein
MLTRAEIVPEKKKPQRAGQGFSYRVMWACCAVRPERAIQF